MKIKQFVSENKLDLTISLILIILIVGAFFPFQKISNPFKEGESEFQPENQVAILDQFRGEKPEFSKETRKLFAQENIGVDIYEDLTVDLYRQLPKLGYKVIILRVHSGGRLNDGEESNLTLFTTEKYDPQKYLILRSNKLVGRAFLIGDDETEDLFGIAPAFIKEEMNGNFDDSLIILNSCNITKSEDSSNLVQNFQSKGAKSVVSWNENITLSHGDEGVKLFLKNMLQENMTLKNSADQVLKEQGPGPNAGAELIVSNYPGAELGIKDGKLYWKN